MFMRHLFFSYLDNISSKKKKNFPFYNLFDSISNSRIKRYTSLYNYMDRFDLTETFNRVLKMEFLILIFPLKYRYDISENI